MSIEGKRPPAEGRLDRIMARVRWLLVALAASLCVFSWWSFARADSTAAAAPRFFCPMHPQVKSHDPGECPICQMTLEPIPVQRKKPAAPALPAGSVAASSGLPPDVAPSLTLSLDRVQAINVRTREARLLPGSGKLTLPAVVEAQERGRAEVHVRSAGFVERVAVRETGAVVKAGQELFALYSPEIYQAQSELLALKRLGGDADGNVDRARGRLELLGVSSAQSAKLLQGGAVSRTVSVSAPLGGYVARLGVVQGAFVTPEAVLYEIVDPSRVYVVASLPESRAREVSLGQAARFLAGDADTMASAGKIDLIYPELDRNARSVKLRLSLDNAQGHISPGQFGRVELSLMAEPTVAVPRDSVIDTGRGAYVFVDEGQGHFRAASVETGAALPEDELEIRKGVLAGEHVVSGAAFLLDSESRLRASLAPSE
jgi:membrane fusion protein, copper/silver efflux system